MIPIMIALAVCLAQEVKAIDYGTYSESKMNGTILSYDPWAGDPCQGNCSNITDDNDNTWMQLNTSGANNIRISFLKEAGYDSHVLSVLSSHYTIGGTPRLIYCELPRNVSAGTNITVELGGNTAAYWWFYYSPGQSILGLYCPNLVEEDDIPPYDYTLFTKIYDLDMYYYKDAYLNLTFDSSSNGTLHSEGLEINWTGTNITRASSVIEEGKVTVTFGGYQRFEYENEEYSTGNWTDIEKNAHIFASPDKNQEIRVWDGSKNIEDANVWIYEIIDNEEYLVYGLFTDKEGEGIATLESGKAYKFCAYHDDYNPICEYEYIVPSTDDTITIRMEYETSVIYSYVISSTCSLYETSAKDCAISVNGNGQPSNITWYWQVNETGSTMSQEYSYTHPTHTVGLNWANATINGSVWIDGTEYAWFRHEMKDYDWDIGPLPSFTAADSEEKALAILIWMIISAAIGGIANEMIRGSGIYTYAILMALMGISLQVLAVPALMITLIIIYNVGRNLIPGR